MSSLTGEINIENSLFLGELLGEMDKEAGFKINVIGALKLNAGSQQRQTPIPYSCKL